MQAVLDACRARGWCTLALQLLAAVEALGRAPTVEQIDAVLAACAAGGAVEEVGRVGGSWGRVEGSLLAPVCRYWTIHTCPISVAAAAAPPLPHGLHSTRALPIQARTTFNKLATHGLRPSPASRAALAEAQCAAGQWADAVQDYEALIHSR